MGRAPAQAAAHVAAQNFFQMWRGKRAIKVCLHTQELSPFATLQSFGQWLGLLMRTSNAMHWCLCVRLHMPSCH